MQSNEGELSYNSGASGDKSCRWIRKALHVILTLILRKTSCYSTIKKKRIFVKYLNYFNTGM